MTETSLKLVLHEKVLDAFLVKLVLYSSKGCIHLVVLCVDYIRRRDWRLSRAGLVSMHHFSLRARWEAGQVSFE